MPFGSLYFQGFQTAGLGNSATLDSGLRHDERILSLQKFARKQCHVRQWIKTLLLPVPPKPGFRPSETVPR